MLLAHFLHTIFFFLNGVVEIQKTTCFNVYVFDESFILSLGVS